jgi:predicted carbohydrate-binding protein with CBM5 and CBM33 domain
MTALPRVATAVVTGSATMLLTVSSALPAAAHGSLERPASRTHLCGDEGSAIGSPACRAAFAADGVSKLPDWDYQRIADVDGRDREVVPDGELCSAGLTGFRGLDLPRKDWPATKLKAGAAYRFEYRTTIPHQGSFRLYVTKDGWSPAKPLTWGDLESEPFLTVRDPRAEDGAYRMPGTLPAGKTGRHLIYTVWENSDTPDTYYSCSDVVFTGASKAAAKPKAAKPAAPPAASVAAATATPTALAAANAALTAEREAAAAQDTSVLPFVLVSVMALLVAGGIVVAARRSSRR